MASKHNPRQRALPLAPQPPVAAEIDAKLAQWWAERAWLHRNFKSLADALADPERARRLRLCARQALMARQRAMAPGR